MYINRRRLKKKAKENKWFRLVRLLGIEIGFIVVFLSFLLLVFHKQTKSLLSPLVRVRSSIASALGMPDETDQIRKLLEGYNISYTGVSSQGNDAYTIMLPDNARVTVGGSGDLMHEINTLQVILNRLTMEGKRFDTLDLRFARPIIHIKNP
jgi:hypothetical protein